MKLHSLIPKKSWAVASVILMALALTAVASVSEMPTKKLKVVTTTTDLCAVAKVIGGDLIEVDSICKGGQDSHTVAAKPSYMMKARKADLWVCIGLMHEAGYERPILSGSRNKNILYGKPGHLDCSIGVTPLDVKKDVASNMGITLQDAHPKGNPHWWTDPYNIRIAARSIAKRLGELDKNKENAAIYDANCRKFLLELDNATFGSELVAAVGGDKLWELEFTDQLGDYLKENETPELGGWKKKMQPLDGIKIVTYHKSFTYFARRFGLEPVIEVEPAPGIPPSPGHVIKVIAKMKTEDIKLILKEPYYSPKAPDKIAGETGGAVVNVSLSVDGQPGTEDYLKLIDHLVESINKSAVELGLIPAGNSDK
jgi:zinc/manganese transport system substrate-binding protein